MTNNDPITPFGADDPGYGADNAGRGKTQEKQNTDKPRTTSGSGCGVTAACLTVALLIVAAALVLRVM